MTRQISLKDISRDHALCKELSGAKGDVMVDVRDSGWDRELTLTVPEERLQSISKRIGGSSEVDIRVVSPRRPRG